MGVGEGKELGWERWPTQEGARRWQEGRARAMIGEGEWTVRESGEGGRHTVAECGNVETKGRVHE